MNEGERGAEEERRETGNAAEMAEAARRAAEKGLEVEEEAGAGVRGWVGGGWLQRNCGHKGLSEARLPVAHPARTVFPLAKSQRFYRSLSDPPNWLLMTP